MIARPLAAALLCCALWGATPAKAALTQAELDTVSVNPLAGVALPPGLAFTDSDGKTVSFGSIFGHRPAVLVLADYECREICGPVLAIVAAALGGTGLTPGTDFDLISVGINERATATDALQMRAVATDAHENTGRASHVLSGSREVVAALERSLNYVAVYDPSARRFAHPSDVFVLTKAGALSRVLPGLALDPATLRMALVEAGEGRLGTIVDRLRLLCYGLDAAHGVASDAVGKILAAGGLLTLGGMWLAIRSLRPRPIPPAEDAPG